MATLVGSILAVAYLADSVGEHGGPSRVDSVIASDMLDLRTPLLTWFARALTFLGSELVVGLIAVLLFGFLLWRRRTALAVPFGLAMGGSVFLTVALKVLVARPRPPQTFVLGPIDHSYSFPSGHTLNSAVLLVLVVWLLWPRALGLGRVLLVESGALLASGIGASRVYLGYHWTTDVCASWLVALGWLSVVVLISGVLLRTLEHAIDRHPSPPADRPPPG